MFSHQMVDLMCSFDFRVLCFVLHLFSPWICVLHVWVIGWDYSMFLCPSAAMVSSSISSSSCCRGAQLLGICQSEVWSHMFLESLNLEVVSFWAPLTFSIGKLQKLALSVWAWHFVSFFSIFMVFRSCLYRFCLKHSGSVLFACLVIFALSAGAVDALKRLSNEDALRAMN